MPKKGYKMSIEQKKKLSLIKIEAYKNGNWKGMTGKLHKEGSKEKMRLKKLGSTPWNKGKSMSIEYREIMRIAQTGAKHFGFRDEKHHGWKGDNAGYAAIHIWVKRRKPKPEFCEECKEKTPMDLANISQKYKRNINDFEWLCRRCHMVKDGRIKGGRRGNFNEQK